jgi:hypothetical protein
MLVLTDGFFKWTIAVPTRDQTQKFLYVNFAFGLLYVSGSIQTGKSFESEISQQLCTIYRLRKREQRHIIRRGTDSVKDSTGRFTICYDPYHQKGK